MESVGVLATKKLLMEFVIVLYKVKCLLILHVLALELKKSLAISVLMNKVKDSTY